MLPDRGDNQESGGGGQAGNDEDPVDAEAVGEPGAEQADGEAGDALRGDCQAAGQR